MALIVPGGEYATEIKSCDERAVRYREIEELHGVDHMFDYIPFCSPNGFYQVRNLTNMTEHFAVIGPTYGVWFLSTTPITNLSSRPINRFRREIKYHNRHK